jgi:RNase P/RNase MRP subunit p29
MITQQSAGLRKRTLSISRARRSLALAKKLCVFVFEVESGLLGLCESGRSE